MPPSDAEIIHLIRLLLAEAALVVVLALVIGLAVSAPLSGPRQRQRQKRG